MAELSELRARIDGLMIADRRGLRRRLDSTRAIAASGKRASALKAIESAIDKAERTVARRRALVPDRLRYPAELPITDRRDEILDTMRDHQVVVIAGETGSGKSTQIPKLCLELGRGVEGLIGHTQPRRIAARSIAERIAEETGSAVGGLVGYTVRFTDRVGDATLIKVMTDGILLAEIQRDRRLTRYDTIIIDEAHERSLNIDFLLGYLKQLLPKRPDLKVIITSATIDTARFSEHFDNAPIIEVSGRTHPVEVRYRPLEDPHSGEPIDQPQGIADAVAELAGESTGDILVFCSGEREIRDAVDAISELNLRHTEILPLFGRLSAADQHRIVQQHIGRRVVVSTNVAETSLTVPGIRSVVDAGTARISRYHRRTKVQRLPIEPISQASADQRAGRCGRLGPGVCIRLYAEDDYQSRPAFTEPEVQRTNLASVILQMAAIGLGEVEDFPFVDPPDTRTIRDGVALLEELGAVDPQRAGTRDWLTDLGRTLSRLPVDPRLGRMLIEAERNHCLTEVLTIVAALAIQDPRERPVEHRDKARQLHARFANPDSDFLGWLQLWAYLRTERRARSSNQFRRMCRDEFLNHRRIREWQDVRAQLREVADELKLTRNRAPADPESIHRSLLAGLLSQVGTKDPESHEYRAARGARFSISPGSGQFKRNPEWVMAGELVETTRLWAHTVAPIDPAWIEALAPHLISRTHSDPWWDAERGSVLAYESVTMYGIPVVTDRTVQYARIDQAGARDVFIRHALVLGEWETTHGFVAHNAEQIEAVRALEARKRVADLLVEDDVIHDFYAARLPPDIVSTRHFDAWWKDARHDSPGLLDMDEADLIDPEASGPDAGAFPEVWHLAELELPLTYEFDPTSRTDGVTVTIPVGALERLDPAVFDWQVPGHRRELVGELIRSLPKQIRKTFVPIPETVAAIAGSLDPADGPLVPALRRVLTERSGRAVPLHGFDRSALPHHLRMMFSIVDEAGTEIARGEDLDRLREELAEAARAAAAPTSFDVETTGQVEWVFGDLPAEIEVRGPHHTSSVYPALVDEGDTVGVRVLATEAEQATSMWDGTRRLVLLGLPGPRRLARSLIGPALTMALATGPYPDVDAFVDDALGSAIDDILADAGGPVWTEAGFAKLMAVMRDHLAAQLETVIDDAEQILVALADVERLAGPLTADRFRPALNDVTDQLGRLIYPGFLTGLGAERLPHVARYVAAARRRLERLPEDPRRDYREMQTIQALEAIHDRLVDDHGYTADLVDITWMLQELRVSVFAQALGVQGAVSHTRVRKALAAVEREA